MLHIRKRIKDIFGGHPVEGSHGESVIVSLSDSKLFGKVIKGIESVAGIELLIIFFDVVDMQKMDNYNKDAIMLAIERICYGEKLYCIHQLLSCSAGFGDCQTAAWFD